MAKSTFSVLPYGAILQGFRIGDRNIVLNFPTQELYERYNTPYFGATIGRTANRIADGVLKDLNGRSYKLTTEPGQLHSLHGGVGWSHRTWEGPHTVVRNGREALAFTYLSKDGEDGYPGTVEARVYYSTSREGEDKGVGENGEGKTVLEIEFEAELVGDECEETVVSMTNHTYFNIGDGPTIDGTEAMLKTDKYLPIDPTGIPLGSIETYEPIRVTRPFYLDATYPDIDDCFVMDDRPSTVPIDTRPLPLRLNAFFRHVRTDLRLEVFSTEPAFQFYTGKYIDVPAVDVAPDRQSHAGFAVEPGRFTNAANVPEWKGMCVLKKGEVYGSKIVYKAWKGN
ncbi:hypothetical protein MPDQ_005404 [Monascus purpureus]|uniref:Aldose 1-epimerase n=1 Tax=Monascus purpureus TaxID=5098 RepID=A0A507QWW6_MONPU|nr:hypothetical protein MPDQ_005404 [Monascus purpureus]BDD60094.1 hypothetical protein MAP00_005257 [Monascus purpureus]